MIERPYRLHELERENADLRETVKEQEKRIEYLCAASEAERGLDQIQALRIKQQSQHIELLESQLKQLDDERMNILQKMDRLRRELAKFTNRTATMPTNNSVLSPFVPPRDFGFEPPPDFTPVPFTPVPLLKPDLLETFQRFSDQNALLHTGVGTFLPFSVLT